jgi:hypothetical protein
MTARSFDSQGWQPHAAAPRDDGPESLREWRWRSYADHLEDLGYDLDGGGEPDPQAPAGMERPSGRG